LTAADRVRALLAISAGKPCPTDQAIGDTLGLSVHAVRQALADLVRRRLLRAQRTGQRGAYSRRIRVLVNGRWTAWTKWTQRAQKRECADHVARVLTSGNYQNASKTKSVAPQAA